MSPRFAVLSTSGVALEAFAHSFAPVKSAPKHRLMRQTL